MGEVVKNKVVNVVAGKVRDKSGRPAPKEIVQALRKAGVVSFSFKGDALDWDLVKEDAESLFEQQLRTSDKAARRG